MTVVELKMEKRWVGYTTINGNEKVPMNPLTGGTAKSTDPETWGTYAEAMTAKQRYGWKGVGLVLTGDGLVGIDLDSSLTEVGDELRRSGLAKHLMSLANSYTEISPSGKGLHILGYADLSKNYNTKIGNDKLEMYYIGRYLTYTEDFVDNDLTEIKNIQTAIDEAIDLINAEKKPTPTMLATAPTINAKPLEVQDGSYDTLYHTLTLRAISVMENAQDGQKHATRIKAGRLMGGVLQAFRDIGYETMTDDEAVDLLYNAMIPADNHPREYRAISDGLEYGLQAPINLSEYNTKKVTKEMNEIAVNNTGKKYHLTDMGNGLRLVDACESRLIWVAEWRAWLVWDGKRWRKGDESGVVKLAHQVALSIYDEISQETDKSDREKVLRWAEQSESLNRINSMIASAKPYLTKSSEIFDTHAHLLNVANGVIDLRTGTLMPHNPSYFITKVTEIEFNSTTPAPKWDSFLNTIFMGNSNLMDFIQRAVGYTLTGSTDEHCLFFMYGVGANGKSTFLEAMRLLMTEYYVTTDVNALLNHEVSNNATPYVASLPGMRMAMASEMPENRKLNESLVKDITGGGTITARHLYGSPFEFQPSHTIWVAGNHKPKIQGSDEGIWRRLRVIPFNAFIAPEDRKPMSEIMADFKEELEGILAWAVAGAVLWYKSGLPRIAEIEQANKEYRGEEDILQRFLDDECEVATTNKVNKRDFYNAFITFCRDEGETEAAKWSIKELTHKLKRKDITLGGNGRAFYMGVKVNQTGFSVR